MTRRTIGSVILAGVVAALGWSQAPELKTTEAVLEKYQWALGGAEAIRKVQSETRHGEVASPGTPGKITFVSYAKPFKWFAKITMPDGTQRTSGFDGKVSWSVGAKGAEIDTSVPIESVRRDADLSLPTNSPASPISRAIVATGSAARLIGARTTINSTMSIPVCSSTIAFKLMIRALQLPS